jgi:Tfp pilus assembly protein PilO
MKIDRPIAIAIIIFIIILLMYFLVVPKYYEFRDFQKRLGEVEAEYNGKFAYYSEVSKIFRQLEDRKESLEKINNAIPSKPQLADLLYYFQQTGTDSGMIVKNIFLTKISPIASESKASGNSVNEIIFSVDVAGSYRSFKNFLFALENSSRLFEVGNLGFGSSVSSKSALSESADRTSTQQAFSFKLEIKTHSY